VLSSSAEDVTLGSARLLTVEEVTQMNKTIQTTVVALVALLLAVLVNAPRAHAPGAPKEVIAAGSAAAPATLVKTTSAVPRREGSPTAAYGKIPLGFAANLGQTDSSVRFLAGGDGYRLFLTDAEAVLALVRPGAVKSGPVLRMQFGRGERPLSVSGLDELPGRANWLVGSDVARWRTDIPLYARVHYADVYPGVDLVFHGEGGRLEYDFELSPGADVRAIRVELEGAEKLAIDDHGDLLLSLPGGGTLRQLAPVAYQPDGRVMRRVPSRYVLIGPEEASDPRIGFVVGAYDPALPLVIDPVLSYSSFLGGGGTGGFDAAYGIATDHAGNAYVTGLTASSDFPGAGASVTSIDAFVTKVNAAGSAIVYSTTFGGSDRERGNGIALDISGNVFVTGRTESIDFPTTQLAYDRTCGTDGLCNPGGFGPQADAFVTKLNATGSTILYSTYLGGSGFDNGNSNRFLGDGVGDIAVDAGGNAYVTGSTQSADFPVTPDAFQGTDGGGVCTPGSVSCPDAFVTKLNADGSRLLYSTYLGGSDIDEGFGIALDAARAVYVAGTTISTDFPTTIRAVQRSPAGGNDGFVAKLEIGATELTYSSYLGGSLTDQISAVAVRGRDAYVTGVTTSFDFPTTPGVFQPTKAGDFDAFVTRVNAIGSRLIYSSYLGGLSDELPDGGIAVDGTGRAYLTGTTESGDFPHKRSLDACTATLGMFVTVVEATGSGIAFSTCLDGALNDFGTDIAVDARGRAYVTGHSSSSGAFSTTPFPTTAGAFQPDHAGNLDAVVVKIGGSPLTSP
jgi:hypothetical protein